MITPKVIGSAVILAACTQRFAFDVHPDHMDAVHQFFDTDPDFDIKEIIHHEQFSTVSFQWGHMEKEKNDDRQ